MTVVSHTWQVITAPCAVCQRMNADHYILADGEAGNGSNAGGYGDGDGGAAAMES